MKRYFVFAGNQYYPRAGMSDFVEDFDHFDDAVSRAKSAGLCDSDWSLVWDSQVRDNVWQQLHGRIL